jgi:WD40 repeat protein
MKSDESFVTVGKKHYKCWEGKGTTFKPSKSNAVGSLVLTGVEFAPNGDSIVGASDGKLMVFGGTSLKKALEGHSKCIDSVAVQHNHVYSGAKDGKIIVRGLDYK